MQAETGSLFPELDETGRTTDEYAGLSWSYSRREAFDQCTRRYFFQYYSSALESSELKAKVSLLKNVKNRYLRTGDLVHLVISTYFKKLKLGNTLSADWLVKWAQELFLKDRNYSVHIRAGGLPSTMKFPPALLDEVLTEREGHGALLSQSEEQMVRSIKNFFSPAFSEFRTLGALSDSYIERKLSLQGFPARITGKLDLAAKATSCATVVDWKTGTVSDGGAESLQLATYGIWASAEFKVTEGELRIAKAYLPSEEIVEFKADGRAFENARVRILQDLERMVILHRYGKLGAMEAFTPNPQQGLCALCSFREVCVEGKAIIDA